MQPLLNTIDLEILMHKDAHFGGSFPVMLEYYENDGVGVQEDFEIERIRELSFADTEGHLSSEVLPELAKSDVLFSKELYKKFRDCYEDEDELPKKLADLILSESLDPAKEIQALTRYQKRAIKPLVEILLQDYFYNPLNPGYGRGPINAAIALKTLGNKDAIPYLFNALGKSFTVDEVVMNALMSFEGAGLNFLQDRLKGSPYTKDNYLAAMALASFATNDETACLALNQLQRKDTFSHPSYVSYLICICEGLENNQEREIFAKIAKGSDLKPSIAAEMALILKFW